MTDPDRMGGVGTVLIYERDTSHRRRRYPTVWAERVRRTSLSTWERRVVIGGPDQDSDEFISTWNQTDYSGGFGIEDANESTDVARVRFIYGDSRSPKHLTHAPKTLTPSKPSWATGDSMPLGDVYAVSGGAFVTPRFYNAWGSHAAGWIESTLSYSATDNNLGMTPLQSGTQFGGYLFVPCGASGFVALRQQTDATQTLGTGISSHTATIFPRCFATTNNQLYAIDTTNRLWAISALGVETSPITVTASTWVKQQVNALDLVLDRSHTPQHLVAWVNRDGKPTLWCITNKGAFMLLPDTPEWLQVPMKPSPHPNFGKGAVVWREQEDLWVPAGGLDITRFTGSFIDVPLSGVNKDQGVPPEYNGNIVDLEAERSTLYALIKGLPPVAGETIDPIEAPGSEAASVAVPSVPMWLAAYSGTGWCCMSRDLNTTGDPTWMHISTAADSYRLHWGGTDGQARSMLIPEPFYNPRTKVSLQVDPFAPDAEWETIRFDANMGGWDKIASHCFAMTDFATPDQYIDVYYRTDANNLTGDPLAEPEYVYWKKITSSGQSLLWFDDGEIAGQDQVDPTSNQPWHEGVPFQWIQFKFVSSTNDEMLAMIWSGFSVHHIRVPQDAASYVIKIPFYDEPTAKGFGYRSGKEMARTLREMQRLRKFVRMQVNNYESLRGRIVGISEEAWPGGENFSSVMVVNFVEIGASQNSGLVVV